MNVGPVAHPSTSPNQLGSDFRVPHPFVLCERAELDAPSPRNPANHTPKIHFGRVARQASHIATQLRKLLEHHERHHAVEVSYFSAVATRVAGL